MGDLRVILSGVQLRRAAAVAAALIMLVAALVPAGPYAWGDDGAVRGGAADLAPASLDGEPAISIEGAEAPVPGTVLRAVTADLPEEATVSWYAGSAGSREPVGSGPELELTDAMLCSFVCAVAEVDGVSVAEDSIYFSNLPVVYIETDDGEAITSKEEYKAAAMRAQGNGEFAQQYDGAIQIRGRRNSTWGQPKKPYKVKLDSKADLFSMGSNKHWVLLANYLDPSLVRNTVAQDMALAFGLATMDSVWVDVVLNGELIGNYQLSEQIRVDGTRIDVYDWEELAEDLAKAFYKAKKADGMTKGERDQLEDALVEDLSWVTSGEFSWGGALSGGRLRRDSAE